MIRERGVTWQVRVYAGSDPATGKKRHLYGTACNKRAAVKLENQLISRAERITPEKHSFNHLLDEWMKVARHAPTTQRNTRTQLDRHVRPVLGDLPIGEITTQRLDGFGVGSRRAEPFPLEVGVEPV